MALFDYLFKNGYGGFVKDIQIALEDKVDKDDIATEVKDDDPNPVSGEAVFEALKGKVDPADIQPIPDEDIEALFE